jgi:GGDEF domain-containing protein
MDPSSGLYTEFGLDQLAEQLEARAVRNHEAFACLAFSSDPSAREHNANSDTDSTAFSDLANAVRGQARRSDVVAKKGESQLALLAPDTDAAGARLLVARLQREIDASRGRGRGSTVRLRAGICAVSDLATAKLDVHELVHRAESALAHIGTAGVPQSVISFDELPA